jgi:acetolactate synthase-1/3 small subunit
MKSNSLPFDSSYPDHYQMYTISIYTEDNVGLLGRMTQIFTRRKLNISSITASESEVKGVHRFTIVLPTHEALAVKVVQQINKQVGVLKAFLHTDETIVWQEIALYKVRTAVLTNGEHQLEKIIRKHFARILSVEPEFVVIEKTGHKDENLALFNDLEPLGVLEFVRSGRVAITKPMKEIATYLKELEEQKNYLNVSNN